MSLQLENHTLIVSEELSFSSIKKIYQAGLKLIVDGKVSSVDFSQAKIIDSSALALLTSWLRQAKKHHQKITYQNLPTHLLDVAKLSNLDTIING